MKTHIIKLILAQDFHTILDWAKSLSDEDRYTSLDVLMNLKTEDIITEPRPEKYNAEYYEKYGLVNSIITYMEICCVRSKKDLPLTIRKDAIDKKFSVVNGYLCKPGFGVEPIIKYFELYPPDYLDEIVEHNSKPRQWSNNDFHVLWNLYKQGWVKFDEEIFVRSLFIIPMSHRKTMEDVRFLADKPEAIDKVLMQFYKYEIPILDISKWYTKEGFCCKKCFEYWDEVFSELLSLGALKDRSIVRNLLTTLTFNWKKGHLDWHIRLLKLFDATKDEYLANQDYLLAALSANSNSVCNFVINTVETLYKEKDFDADTFFQNLPNLFVKEKSEKAIQKALDIVSYLLENNSTLRQYTSSVSSALMQPNDKIQESTALILKQYLDDENLRLAVEPFASSLKQKARDIIPVSNTEVREETVSALDNYPLEYPSTWEDFLFHIGKTLGSLDAADIDIMYNGFVQLQDQFPEKYVSQLKPFIKKVAKADSSKELLVYMSEFFESWLSSDGEYKITNPMFVKYDRNPNPYMRERNKWVLDRLHRGCKLPLISTPTHYPFYIHPAILVFRLGEYEKANEEVQMEDLIVACNRILKADITKEVKDEAKKLKGYYATAIQYLLGISDKIDSNKDTLPLWTQIARTKNIDGVFPEFEKTKAKDYPAVVKPFYISYEIERKYSESGKYHWDYIRLDDLWNSPYSRGKEKIPFPQLYFYTAHNSFAYTSKDAYKYWLSLIPHYCNAVLLYDLPSTASGNEVNDFEYCLFPLQYLIENQMQVHHSGWLYIALCLVFEKKVSRTLAAEYINMAYGQGFMNEEYLSESITTMIMNKFAPVNRLVEYFDMVNPDHIKLFQLLIIEKCIERADKDNLPVNFKKLIAYHGEICNQLGVNMNKGIETKIKGLKK